MQIKYNKKFAVNYKNIKIKYKWNKYNIKIK